ncbi:unnamed protein product [Cyclocybe aegerita]|uniref:Uncharacterized protein n=1 Tax=Cyclocybe aegerita TaxID=1973307 RepID=A0A8S0WSQ7_CYCAE|nr:unnamed protein product [Cyclocybe aegerita]
MYLYLFYHLFVRSIGTALAILKTKDPAQSCFGEFDGCRRSALLTLLARAARALPTNLAYIQGLKTAFPVSVPLHAIPDDDLWKNRALGLEQQYADLKMEHDALQIQCASKPRAIAVTDSGPSKKKNKKVVTEPAPTNQDEALPPADLQLDVSAFKNSFEDLCLELKPCSDGLPFPGQDGKNLYAAQDALFKLLPLATQSNFPIAILLSATRRAFIAVSRNLDSIIKANAKLKTLAILAVVLHASIEKSIPPLASVSPSLESSSTVAPLSSALNLLLDCIFLPIVKSFSLLSGKSLEYLSKPPNSSAGRRSSSKSSNYTDLRPSLLSLLQGTLTCLHTSLLSSFKQKPRSSAKLSEYRLQLQHALLEFSLLQHSLILETLRHLKELLEDTAPGTPQTTDRHHRIQRLVIKDTLWYLCSVLQFSIGFALDGRLSEPIAQAVNLVLLKKTTLKLFVDLVVNHDGSRSRPCLFEHESLDNMVSDEIAGCMGKPSLVQRP